MTVGGVTPPPTRNGPLPVPPPTPGPAEGGPGTPFGSPRFSKLICNCASWGATTVGSTINFGSGFFGGSGSGGTNCLSAGRGNSPLEGGVSVFLPPPPPPPAFSLSG